MTRSTRFSLLVVAAFAASHHTLPAQPNLHAAVAEVAWREVGPFRGGRSTAVAGHPRTPLTFFTGSCGGGLWRTTNGGLTWHNVSDGYFGTGSIGAVTVAPSRPQTVYAGTGECSLRGDVSHGDGAYRSDDGGKTWRRIGLTDSRHIARIIVDRDDHQRLFAACLGHLAGPNEERGVFRSLDGGETWHRVLFRGADVGAIEVRFGANSNELYASMWDVRRRPWGLRHGGPGSGIFRSNDGGDTWQELTRNKGLPTGPFERIAMATAATRKGRVWALVSAAGGKGLYRSDDHGETWQLINAQRDLVVRPYYLSHIEADPTDADTVYVVSYRLWRSRDGGAKFTQLGEFHVDHHDLWISPANPSRMIAGTDGGASVTPDGGTSWTSTIGQSTAQMYSVACDNNTPYALYGAQQDWGMVSVPSREWSQAYGISSFRNHELSECGRVALPPSDPNVVFVGDHHWLNRLEVDTGAVSFIGPTDEIHYGWGTRDLPLRFTWVYPMSLSKHDDNVLYVGSQFVHRSADRGRTWEVISPDLTRAEPATLNKTQDPYRPVDPSQDSWGPVTRDSNGDFWYATLWEIEESPHDPDVLWTGSDDGVVQLTRDGGRTWKAVTPTQLEPHTIAARIHASSHARGTAFLAATAYRRDEFSPMLFATHDYGASWQRVDAGLPRSAFTREIVEDPVRAGLLYCGTELGAFYSPDRGARWFRFGGLPTVPVHELLVVGEDLVAATHGRGFWIFDHLNLLRAMDPVHTHLSPRAATLPFGKARTPGLARGATIPLWLDGASSKDVTMTVRDRTGQVLHARSLGELGAGLHLLHWNLRELDEHRLEGAIVRGRVGIGPQVVPGSYQVGFDGLDIAPRMLVVRADPRSKMSPEDRVAKRDALRRIRAELSHLNRVVTALRAWREDLVDASLQKQITLLEDRLVQHRARTSKDLLALPVQLDNKLYTLANRIDASDAPPTSAQRRLIEDLSERCANVFDGLRVLARENTARSEARTRLEDALARK